MRLNKISFDGYKRLRQATCRIDGKVIAFVGPNEAGKSSVLQGLGWMANPSRTPLPGYLRSRGRTVPDDTEVVRAEFSLEPSDLTLVADVPVEARPENFVLAKTAAGQHRYGLSPLAERPHRPFDAAVKAVEALRIPAEGDFAELRNLVTQSVEVLTTGWRRTLDDDDNSGLTKLVDLLRDPSPLLAGADTDAPSIAGRRAIFRPQKRVADLVQRAIDAGSTEHPTETIRQRLIGRAPKFEEFTDADRNLQTTYNVADDTLRADAPRALVNLLDLAETTLEELFALSQAADPTATQTRLRRINDQLRVRVRPTWQQADITVHLNLEGTVLQVFVLELDQEGSTVQIDERSDGLKMFLALVCFLATRSVTDPPPVLLIDEAETHLHYDAQADLLDVLQDEVKAAKVIYTTHSPGCLPPDLGTGVRLVAPRAGHRDESDLRSNFWTSNEPGFSSLLFAMGAGAAAFSACRRAVLGEGPTEMILLPTLLRIANGLPSLPYQIAPGLAHVKRGEYGADVAGRLVYLVDGDGGGKARKAHLVEAGVPKSSVLALPNNAAIEDLLTRGSYLSALCHLIRQTGYKGDLPTLADLQSGDLVTKDADRWCVAHAVVPPRKPAVANYLIDDPDARIKLTAQAKRTLRSLHAQFSNLLDC